MSRKMVLVPYDQYTSIHEKNDIPADIELKLLRQQKAQTTQKSTDISEKIDVESMIDNMPKTQQKTATNMLTHIHDNSNRIKYDDKSGEISYNNVKAPKSDIRKLVRTATSNRRPQSYPAGWDLFMQSLHHSEAPDDVYGLKKYTLNESDWINI